MKNIDGWVLVENQTDMKRMLDGIEAVGIYEAQGELENGEIEFFIRAMRRLLGVN